MSASSEFLNPSYKYVYCGNSDPGGIHRPPEELIGTEPLWPREQLRPHAPDQVQQRVFLQSLWRRVTGWIRQCWYGRTPTTEDDGSAECPYEIPGPPDRRSHEFSRN